MRRINGKLPSGSTDRYILLDASELRPMVDQHASAIKIEMGRIGGGGWYGSSYELFMHRVVVGDNELVQESEEYLKMIEDQVPMSRGWRNIDDVVGAVPNIPSFLAGHPQCMRRRERTMHNTAPLAIYMDLTTSSGISSTDVQRRGVVLLALTRMLIEHRPVELWVGTSLGMRGKAGTVAWRIDTAPLDLARAAFHISATSMSRAFGYTVCMKELDTGWAWPFNDFDMHVRSAPDRIRAVFSGQEILYIPPILNSDQMTREPVSWVKRIMSRYVKGENE